MGSFIIMDGAAEFVRGDDISGDAPDGMVAVPVPAPWKANDVIATLGEDGEYSLHPRPVPLKVVQDARWALVKAARDKAETSGCMTPLGRVDTDPDSQRKISGAVQMATLLESGFSIAFTMEDDNTVVHDAVAMVAMGLWVGAHVDACHQEGARRRKLIYEAETPEEVEAVPVGTGWP